MAELRPTKYVDEEISDQDGARAVESTSTPTWITPSAMALTE